jgi:hypothetical protein
MQGSAAADTTYLERALGLSADEDSLITLRVVPSTPRHYLTITEDGRVEPGPDLVMDDVARLFLEQCSHAYDSLQRKADGQEQRLSDLERLLRQCRFILRSFGLRSYAGYFWKELDRLLGEDPPETTIQTLFTAKND